MKQEYDQVELTFGEICEGMLVASPWGRGEVKSVGPCLIHRDNVILHIQCIDQPPVILPGLGMELIPWAVTEQHVNMTITVLVPKVEFKNMKGSEYLRELFGTGQGKA